MTDTPEEFVGELVTDEKKAELKKKEIKGPGFNTEYTGEFMMSGELPLPDYLIHDFLARGNLTNLSGPPGGGKTVLAISLIVQNHMDTVLGKKCKKPFRTLLIDEENGISQTILVYRKAMNGIEQFTNKDDMNEISKNVRCFSMEGFTFNTEWGIKLEFLLDKYKKAGVCPDLIIIDNVSRTFEGDSNKIADARIIHKLLKKIALDYNLAVLLISHTRKGDPTCLADISGSADFGAQVTIGYIVKIGHTKDDEVSLWFKKVKNNIGFPTGRPESLLIKNLDFDEIKNEYLSFTLTNEGLVSEVMKKQESITDNIRDEILKICINPTSWKDIVIHLLSKGYKDGTIRGVLANMRKDESIIKDGSNWKVI